MKTRNDGSSKQYSSLFVELDTLKAANEEVKKKLVERY